MSDPAKAAAATAELLAAQMAQARAAQTSQRLDARASAQAQLTQQQAALQKQAEDMQKAAQASFAAGVISATTTIVSGGFAGATAITGATKATTQKADVGQSESKAQPIQQKLPTSQDTVIKAGLETQKK